MHSVAQQTHPLRGQGADLGIGDAPINQSSGSSLLSDGDRQVSVVLRTVKANKNNV